MRLDKYLADMQCGTRSQLKTEIKKGAVTVNGKLVKKADTPVSPGVDAVCYHGKSLSYVAVEYYMFHKPAGCVSATEDNVHPTVLSYINAARKDLFPVGRLDIDTEGLLLITNDGALAHALLAPKRHIPKTYYAKVDGNLTEADVRLFAEGMDIGEKKETLPAELVIKKQGTVSEALVTIYEGKFHQIKRMFAHIGKPVCYLKRIAMGELLLDDALAPGEYRSLTEAEINYLKNV